MDDFGGDALVTSLAALATALLVALWNVGGWAALQRRTMRQELEIANALRPGVERQRLEQVALERATLYVHQRSFVGPSVTRLRRLTFLTLSLPVVFAMNYAMMPLGPVFWMAGLGEIFLFSGLLGFWTIRGLRVLWARGRRRELKLAIDQLDARPAASA